MPLQMRLFDRNYGDFNGEFEKTTAARCTYDVQKWVSGLVSDSLSFDITKGKKIPRRGSANDACTDSLEKWFDPAAARLSVCGELPLQNAGTSQRPNWTFNSEYFFPMDARSVQPDLGRDNDFAFCMEINAGFVARGGEALRFHGDDDLWVYLDGRLVIDRGGIHFTKGDTVLVDTLPSSLEKRGSYRHLDIYFCSRVPGTSVFGMESPLDPVPLPLKSLRITDTAGKELTSRDVVIGKTRVCAGPSFQLPDPAACGNFAAPVPFLPADWEFNGRALSGAGGEACVDLDPTGLPHGSKVQLTARYGDKLARISLTVARLAKVMDGVLRGNGRVESVEVPLDSGSGSLPEGLDVEFFLAGRSRYARAFPLGGAVLGGVLGASEQGPPGLSGFSPVTAVTRQTHFGRTVVQSIRLSDGVGPVLTGARLRWSDSGAGGLSGAYLEWESSEELSATALKAADLLGRRGGNTWAGLSGFGAVAGPDAVAPGVGGRFRYRLPLAEADAYAFRPGDSLSLGPTAADSLGNPAGRFFIPVDLPGHVGGALGGFRLAENPARGRLFTPVPGLPPVILVSPQGLPLRDREADRRVSEAGGPVIFLPARAPLRRVALRIYDHLGAAVSSAAVDISPTDWQTLRMASPGDTTWVGLRWYPVSGKGGKLGTGAYVVQGQVWTRDGALVQDAGGAWYRVRGATARFGPSLFGYIRE